MKLKGPSYSNKFQKNNKRTFHIPAFKISGDSS